MLLLGGIVGHRCTANFVYFLFRETIMKKVPRQLKFALIVLTAVYIIGIATMAYCDLTGKKELMPAVSNATLLATAFGGLAFSALAYWRKVSMTLCHPAPDFMEHFWQLPRHHQ